MSALCLVYPPTAYGREARIAAQCGNRSGIAGRRRQHTGQSADRDGPIERHLIAEYRLPSPNALISPETGFGNVSKFGATRKSLKLPRNSELRLEADSAAQSQLTIVQHFSGVRSQLNGTDATMMHPNGRYSPRPGIQPLCDASNALTLPPPSLSLTLQSITPPTPIMPTKHSPRGALKARCRACENASIWSL
jgi:hypothetical protein